jgi:four helix bundle suffix protein
MKTQLFAPHGGYRKLNSFALSTLIYLETIQFCERFLNLRNDPKGRLYDQMVQAARSGRANIMEGSERAGTSKGDEIRLTDVARASLAELMGDYEIWILRHDQSPWTVGCEEGVAAVQFWIDPPGDWTDTLHDSGDYIRAQRKKLARFTQSEDSVAVANFLLVLCKRTIALLNAQMKQQGETFAEQGGFHERMTAVRVEAKRNAQETVKEDAPNCLICGQPMRLRNGKKGQFWGCSAYPTCKGTQEV